MILMMLLMILLIGGGFALARGVWHGRCGMMGMNSRHEDSAMDILKRRYASGEINKEEYDEKKRELV